MNPRLSRLERERLAAVATAVTPRDPDAIPPAPAVRPNLFAALPHHERRQQLRAAMIDELHRAAAGAKPIVRARCLSVAATLLRDWETAEAREIESACARHDSRELTRIRESQKAMRGGPVRECDAPHLPGEEDA